MVFSNLSRRTLTSQRNLSNCTLIAFFLVSSGDTCASWTTPGTTTTVNNSIKKHLFATTKTSTSTMSTDSTLTVHQFPCLNDNYGYLIHDESSGKTAAIDTPCAKTYQKELESRGWTLSHILNTHHHHDHTGGNLQLKNLYNDVIIYGPKNEQEKIPGIDIALGEGDTAQVGNFMATILDVGGHTKGHIAYRFEDKSCVFVGDSIFALGCGKMFEGTPSQFWESLRKLRELPDETIVYCAHEYTESNARFALSVEPNNADLIARVADVKNKRSNGEPTVPSFMGEEKKTNPFLRADISDEIRQNVGVTSDDSDADAFGKVRKAKDRF